MKPKSLNSGCASMVLPTAIFFSSMAIGLLVLPNGIQSAATAQTSPYVVKWSHTFPTQQDCDIGMAPQGTADQQEDLWLTCADYLEQVDGIIHIDTSGKLVSVEKPHLKLPNVLPHEVADFFLAANGARLGLLINVDRLEGRTSYFEGAFFTWIGAEGTGIPQRISGPGPQFRHIVAGPDGGFLIAGDQEPLTLIKLGAGGELLWRRSFSRKLVLPELAVTASGDSYIASQSRHSVVVQRINAVGQLMRQASVPAEQGTVVAAPDGGCALMYSSRAGGENNRVFLTAMNPELRRLWTVPTPLIGKTGRTYQLIKASEGYVALGDGEGKETAVLAGFGLSGRLVWQSLFQAGLTPVLISTASGFYIVFPKVPPNTSTDGFKVVKENLKSSIPKSP